MSKDSNSKLSIHTINLTGIHDDPGLRDEVVKKSSLYELLLYAIALNLFNLKEMGGAESLFHLCNYYPPYPEPEFTIGTIKH